MYLGILISVGICLLILAARYFSEASRPTQKRPTWTRRIKVARLLIGAATALYAIVATLNGLSEKLVP